MPDCNTADCNSLIEGGTFSLCSTRLWVQKIPDRSGRVRSMDLCRRAGAPEQACLTSVIRMPAAAPRSRYNTVIVTLGRQESSLGHS